MWRPDEIGTVIAERRLKVTRRTRRRSVARLEFGIPVRGPEPQDPWWCPVRLRGEGFDLFQAVAGEDSLQALLLALDFATHALPSAAAAHGLQFEWLGESERLVLARNALSKTAESAIVALLGSLKAAAAILDSNTRETRSASRQALDALKAIASGEARSVAKRRTKDRGGGR